jgi:hypothetical protein
MCVDTPKIPVKFPGLERIVKIVHKVSVRKMKFDGNRQSQAMEYEGHEGEDLPFI